MVAFFVPKPCYKISVGILVKPFIWIPWAEIEMPEVRIVQVRMVLACARCKKLHTQPWRLLGRFMPIEFTCPRCAKPFWGRPAARYSDPEKFKFHQFHLEGIPCKLADDVDWSQT